MGTAAVQRVARAILPICVALACTGVGGCASLTGKAGNRLAANLGTAVLDADDPATVRDGLPAYLLLLDGLLEGSPDNPSLLLAAARLNGTYAGNFTGDDSVRAQRLSAKALHYARRATCIDVPPLCDALDGNIAAFQQLVDRQDARRLPLMYTLATAWAGYLQARREDWNAIAELPKIEALLRRTVELDPIYERGQPHVYLGVLHSLRPAELGGQPAQGRADFERAIELSSGGNLYAKVMMAEYHARLVFDRELHDRLLNEVLRADPKVKGFTLTNVMAQERAAKLLAGADDFF